MHGAFIQLLDRLNGVDLAHFRALSQAHNISSEFTTPAWLIFGTRLESRLRCTYCERLSLKPEMVNNVSVDIPPGDSPSLGDALVAYEAEGNMDAEDDLPCTRCKMASARTKDLSVNGWSRVLVVLVNRWVRDPARKAKITKDSTLFVFLSCATKTCLGVTSCGVDTTHVLVAMARLGITSTIRQ